MWGPRLQHDAGLPVARQAVVLDEAVETGTALACDPHDVAVHEGLRRRVQRLTGVDDLRGARECRISRGPLSPSANNSTLNPGGACGMAVEGRGTT